jgi:ABC-type multidrug transport system fused ATPase/permease subunit
MRLAKPDATDREIIAALKHAEAWGFIKEMPNGLSTLLGERGARLSGGQKQRLAIARVFLKNPPIVIFDEATSALDALTETQIQETMQRLYQGRTAVIIAHRLSTIRYCDRIVVLDKGRMLAAGTHTELLDTCPRYRDMVAKQSVDAGV